MLPVLLQIDVTVFSFRVAEWPPIWERAVYSVHMYFVNVNEVLYVLLSLLVLRVGYRI